MNAHPLIFKKISDVMRDCGAIGKDRKNTQQNYQFRGVDDVYNELHDILARHGVFSIPEVVSERTEERTTKSGTVLIYRVLTIKVTFYAEDGSNVSAIVIGEGMDSGDKASNKAMAVADKYACLQVFKIPTEEKKDPENDSPGHPATDGGINPKPNYENMQSDKGWTPAPPPAGLHTPPPPPAEKKPYVEKFPDKLLTDPQKEMLQRNARRKNWTHGQLNKCLERLLGLPSWESLRRGDLNRVLELVGTMSYDEWTASVNAPSEDNDDPGALDMSKVFP